MIPLRLPSFNPPPLPDGHGAVDGDQLDATNRASMDADMDIESILAREGTHKPATASKRADQPFPEVMTIAAITGSPKETVTISDLVAHEESNLDHPAKHATTPKQIALCDSTMAAPMSEQIGTSRRWYCSCTKGDSVLATAMSPPSFPWDPGGATARAQQMFDEKLEISMSSLMATNDK